MSKLDELVIELRANSTQLTASLTAIQKQLGTLANAAQQQQQRVGQAFDGMGDAAKRAAANARRLQQAVDELARKTARDLGMASMSAAERAAARFDQQVEDLTRDFGVLNEQQRNTIALAREQTLQLARIRDDSIKRLGGTARLSSHDVRNLGFQLNDVFVSLASGQDPLRVFIQQGAQIGQIFGGAGGVTSIIKQLTLGVYDLVKPFAPALAAAGVLAVGVRGMTDDIRDATGVNVTFGDTAKAVFQVAAQQIESALRPAIEGLAPLFEKVYDLITRATKQVINSLIGGFVLAADGISNAFHKLPYVLGDIFILAFDGVLEIVETSVNAIIDTANHAIDAANALASRFGKDELIPRLDTVNLEQYQVGLKALPTLFDGAGEAARKAFRDYFPDIKNQAVKNALVPSEEELKQLKKMAEAAEDAQSKLDDLQRAARLDALKTGDDELTQALYEVDAAVADVAAQYEKATGKVFKFTAAQNAQIETIKETRQQTVAWRQIQQAIDDTRTPLEKYRIETEKLEKLKPFAETPEALDAIQRKMEQLGEETNKQAEIFKDFAKDIGDSFSDVFEHLIDRDFDGLFDSVYDAFKKMLARMATLAIAQPIIIPMVTAVGGALGLSQGTVSGITQQLGGGSGLNTAASGASLLSQFGGLKGVLSDPLGALRMAGNVSGNLGYNLANNLGLSANGFGSQALTHIGGALPAAGIGSLIASLAGLGTGNFVADTGLSIGGAALGNLVLPGIGGVLGSVAGQALGGLFGGSRPHPASTFGTQGVFSSPLDLQSKHMDTQFASTLAASLQQALATLMGAGLNLSFIKSLQGGVNDGKGFLSFGDSSVANPLDTVGFDPKNPDAGLAKFLKLVVDQAGDLSQVMDADLIPALKNLSTDGKTSAEVLNEIVAALTRDDQRKAFLDGINNSILDMVLPGFSAMNQEMAQFAANMAQAKALGLTQAQIAQVTELHQLRVRQLQAQNNQAQQKALQTATSLVQKYGSLAGGFGSLLDQLRNGKYTTLTPVANLADLRSQVLSTGAAARLGDADAQERLLSLLPQFLDLSAQVNGYNVEFAKDQGIATDLAEAAKSVAERQLGIQQAILDQATQTNALLSGMGGVPISGGNANDKLVAALNGGYSLSNDLIDTIFNSAGVTVAPGQGRRTNFLNDPANSGINASLNAAFHALGVPGFAGGGWIKGGIPGMDSVPTLHMPDEFTLRAASARSIGAPALEFMNRTGRLPANDNSGEVAALGAKVDRLTAVVAAGFGVSNEHLGGVRIGIQRAANGIEAGNWRN
ncbi:MAG: phage tail length tape measure family protein [Acetobacteraceae bacterium]